MEISKEVIHFVSYFLLCCVVTFLLLLWVLWVLWVLFVDGYSSPLLSSCYYRSSCVFWVWGNIVQRCLQWRIIYLQLLDSWEHNKILTNKKPTQSTPPDTIKPPSTSTDLRQHPNTHDFMQTTKSHMYDPCHSYTWNTTKATLPDHGDDSWSTSLVPLLLMLGSLALIPRAVSSATGQVPRRRLLI